MIRALRHFSWLQFAAMLALVAIGTCAIWSAGNARAEPYFHGVWRSNLITACFGLSLYLTLAFVDYRKVLAFLATPSYVISLILLVAVLCFGSTVFGGRRWLWFFQPSEVAKLCVLAELAVCFGNLDRPWLRGFTGFLLAMALVGVPSVLILAEPDLGTTLTLIPAALAMLLIGRVWIKGLLVICGVSLIAAVAVLGAVYESERPGTSPERRERILRYLPLREHQVRRVKVFLFPEEDILGSGYNLRQAKISIGSGGMRGKGLGKGESNHLKYLPQAISMNDFIFCVWAEEKGYVGSLALLLLFAALVIPGCRVAYLAGDMSGRLLAIGISTLVFAHVYINIAMSIGLVPITGLPLPFISSGRTFLLTVMTGLGLVQSVSVHRVEPALFADRYDEAE